MNIFCITCNIKTDARLAKGSEIYSHRADLYELNFYKCDVCKNYVGTHKNTNPPKPLGCIPNDYIRKERMKIHAVLDPIWKNKKMSRKECYEIMSKELGFNYHSAALRSAEECKKALIAATKINNAIGERDEYIS